MLTNSYISAFAAHPTTGSPPQIIADAVFAAQIEDRLAAAGIPHDKSTCLSKDQILQHLNFDGGHKWDSKRHLH